jgi:uncharacterized membrane protein
MPVFVNPQSEEESDRRFKNNMAVLQARLVSSRLADDAAAANPAPTASASPATQAAPIVPPPNPRADAEAEHAALVKRYMDKGFSENKAIFAAISQREVDAINRTAARRR